jgi:hypothetical protein
LALVAQKQSAQHSRQVQQVRIVLLLVPTSQQLQPLAAVVVVSI